MSEAYKPFHHDYESFIIHNPIDDVGLISCVMPYWDL